MFYALADPTRCAVVELLATHGRMSATEIYGNFSLSHPAISQHLSVLRQAELVNVEKDAQRHLYTLNPGTMRDLEGWVRRTLRLWEQRFEELDRVLEAEKKNAKSGGS